MFSPMTERSQSDFFSELPQPARKPLRLRHTPRRAFALEKNAEKPLSEPLISLRNFGNACRKLAVPFRFVDQRFIGPHNHLFLVADERQISTGANMQHRSLFNRSELQNRS